MQWAVSCAGISITKKKEKKIKILKKNQCHTEHLNLSQSNNKVKNKSG